MNNQNNHVIRSHLNTQQTFYTFRNLTHRSVDLIWINFAGKLEYVRTLQPNEFVDVNTFRSHVWMAIDTILKQRMNIENKSIFRCPGNAARRARNEPIARITLNILLPVRSLKLTVMLNLIEHNLIRSCEDVKQLGLPYTLEFHLCEALKRIHILKTGSIIIHKDS